MNLMSFLDVQMPLLLTVFFNCCYKPTRWYIRTKNQRDSFSSCGHDHHSIIMDYCIFIDACLWCGKPFDETKINCFSFKIVLLLYAVHFTPLIHGLLNMYTFNSARFPLANWTLMTVLIDGLMTDYSYWIVRETYCEKENHTTNLLKSE